MSNIDPDKDFNEQIVAEFRANGGKVGGMFEGAPMVLVHNTGAKSGTERVTPLMYRPGDDDRIHIFASAAGATTNPDWFHNLEANPDVTIEIGTETVPARARVLDGQERDEIWEAQKRDVPQFAEYEKTAGDRQIPVIELARR